MIVLVVLVLMAAFLGGIDYIGGLGLDLLLGV
jgi:preprotein translocase subunit SecE